MAAMPQQLTGISRLQQSQRRRRPATPNQTRALAAAGLLGLALLGSSAALGDGSAALLAATAKGQALVMPRDAPEGTSAIAGLQLEVAVEGAFRVYRVRHQGRIHTARVPTQGRPKQFAFDFERQRLAEVAPSLLVRLGDETDLDRIIEAAGALGGKAYPALGWALLRLPPEANPAAVAQELESRGLAAGAEVQLRNAVYVPL